MAPRKRKISLPDGRTVEGTLVPINASTEHWNEYFLEDGSVLRVKAVVTEAVRIEGEWDAYGNPIYFTASTNILAVSAPDSLMRDGGEGEGE
jgi:hypothetical protein